MLILKGLDFSDTFVPVSMFGLIGVTGEKKLVERLK